MASLQVIVDDYRTKFERRAQVELEYYGRQRSLEDAISEAALARFRGKKLRHQRRIANAVLKESRQGLLASADRLASTTSFDDLVHTVDAVIGPIHGIGELTIYDTALRIGAQIGLTPERVYLHAGTREGAKRLGLNATGRTLEMNDLPTALQHLTAREAEDVLCIYKDKFRNVGPLDGRSNCVPQPDEEVVAVMSSC